MGDDAKKKRVQKRLPLDFFSTRNFVSEKEKPKKKNFQKILKTNMYPPKKNEPAAPEKQGLNYLLNIIRILEIYFIKYYQNFRNLFLGNFWFLENS